MTPPRRAGTRARARTAALVALALLALVALAVLGRASAETAPSASGPPALRAAVAAEGFARGQERGLPGALVQDETLRVGIRSGQTAGCVGVPGAAPPTLDCTVRVGEELVQTVTGWALISETLAPRPVSLSVAPLPAGASFARLEQGLEVPGPVAAEGEVSGRLRFAPGPSDVTTPEAPLELRFTAVGESGAEGQSLSAALRTRLTVLPAGPDGPIPIRGYIFEDQDGDGAWGPDEGAIPDWGVTIEGVDGGPVTVRTDALGRFALDVARRGVYTATVETRAGWSPTTPPELGLDLRGPDAPDTGATVLFGQRRGAGVLRAELRTDRGCLPGDGARYTLGEPVSLLFRVAGAPRAEITLRLSLPDGSERALFTRQPVSGGAWYRFTGRADGPAGARDLTLEASLPGEPGVEAVATCGYLVLTGDAPSIAAEPSALDWGEVPAGADEARALRILNRGGAALRVSDLRVQGGAGTPFRLEPPGGGAPFTLGPGEERALSLRFAAPGPGLYADYLIAASDDPARPLLSVPLEARVAGQGGGLDARIQTDRGCLERGQQPIFFVGDAMRVSFRLDSQRSGSARALVEDLPADGSPPRVLVDQIVPTNRGLYFDARVRPPLGIERLRLTGRAGADQGQDGCSFHVVDRSVALEAYAFEDRNGNGVWDGRPGVGGPAVPGAEPPMAGVPVRLLGPESGVAATDAGGRAAFDVSAAGRYELRAEWPAGWAPTTPSQLLRTVLGLPGEQPAEAVFGARAAAPPSTTPGTTPGATPSATPSATSVAPTPPPPVTATPTPGGPTPPPGDCREQDVWTRLPLGAAARPATSPACYELYVPTRWGGLLTVEAEAGTAALYRDDPDRPIAGPAARLEHPIGLDEQGWYRLLLLDAAGAAAELRFEQRGEAAVPPWNAWHFPEAPEAPGPHLYDLPGAYSRYDGRFGLGSQAFDWEYAQHRTPGAPAWHGHAWGAALASVLLEPPEAAAGFGQDELEGLAADFFDRFGAQPLLWDVPAEHPSPAAGEPVDPLADDLHVQLRAYLRQRGVPLVADLRQASGTGPPEVWVHALHRYRSVLEEDPRAVGDPRTERVLQVRVTTDLVANALYSGPPGGAGSAGDAASGPTRAQRAVYGLVYAPSGEVVPDAAILRPQNWESLVLLREDGSAGPSLYAPQGLADVRPAARHVTGEARPVGRNPYVSSEALEALGLRLRSAFAPDDGDASPDSGGPSATTPETSSRTKPRTTPGEVGP